MQNRFALSLSLFLALAASTRDARAWGLHYLVTDRALEHAASASLKAERVKAEPLEEFLRERKGELATLFDGFYSWLESRGSKRFNRMKFDTAQPTTASFLRAARLHPSTQFLLIRTAMPGETTQRRPVDPKLVSPFENMKAPLTIHWEDVALGEQISAHDVLVTFADEPDWAMDQMLWDIPEYGYGKMPYGEAKGTASRAAFHMLFAHENIIVRTFAKEILEGMTVERIELFTRLAALAFRTGHRYWGYRFSAWAIHYIQDLGQPYHSKAVPHADALYYAKFIISTNKPEIKRITTQLAKNRHYAYEDFVAFGLQQSYVERNELFQNLSRFLFSGPAFFDAFMIAIPPENAGLVEKVTSFAAAHAPGIDRAVMNAYGAAKTEDPSYDLETDPEYKIREVIDAMSPGASAAILQETGKDFDSVGRATRTLIKMILAAATPA